LGARIGDGRGIDDDGLVTLVRGDLEGAIDDEDFFGRLPLGPFICLDFEGLKLLGRERKCGEQAGGKKQSFQGWTEAKLVQRTGSFSSASASRADMSS
jgi:hypothetical protein